MIEFENTNQIYVLSSPFFPLRYTKIINYATFFTDINIWNLWTPLASRPFVSIQSRRQVSDANRSADNLINTFIAWVELVVYFYCTFESDGRSSFGLMNECNKYLLSIERMNKCKTLYSVLLIQFKLYLTKILL